jgi:hypothetical protein
LNTFKITDAAAENISLKDWLDERIAAFRALDETRSYNETIRLLPVLNFVTYNAENCMLQMHVRDVVPIAEELNLEVITEERLNTFEFPIRKYIVYNDVQLFSIHEKA